VEPAPDHGQCGSTRSEQCDRRNRTYRPTISLPQNLQGRKIATNKFGIREMSANGLAGLGFSLVEEAKLVEWCHLCPVKRFRCFRHARISRSGGLGKI
jgi:hypothetical protein